MASMPPLQSLGMPPILVFDGSTPASNSQEGDAAGASLASPKLLSGSEASRQIEEGASPAAHSVRLANPSMTVVQGTLIPAVLETAINSDVPGFARAEVTQDVRSFDRSRILIPRSSRLIGEYKSAPGQGHRRIHLIWTRLIRPDGVSIALASPATDAAGRAGVTGKVNSHFFERLGSALLTSVVGAVNPLARGGATVVVASGDSAANGMIQGMGQRSPTIRVQQGEPVRVFAARDLVFAPTDGDGQ
jgi:type IV secretion system protein VirB10